MIVEFLIEEQKSSYHNLNSFTEKKDIKKINGDYEKEYIVESIISNFLNKAFFNDDNSINHMSNTLTKKLITEDANPIKVYNKLNLGDLCFASDDAMEAMIENKVTEFINKYSTISTVFIIILVNKIPNISPKAIPIIVNIIVSLTM